MKRTKKQYTNLFEDPTSLFKDIHTIMWPNGQPEIWLQDANGDGFKIKASKGKAGLGLTINRIGSNPLTVTGNGADADWTPLPQVDASEVSVTIYKSDEYSQAFKKWYAHEGEYPENLGLKASE